jgi:hypothetical protein
MPLSTIFPIKVVVVSFIGGGNQRKPLTNSYNVSSTPRGEHGKH